MNGRMLLWQIHSWLGISLGIILAIMATTGALMAFQDEIMATWSREVIIAPASTIPDLSPDALISSAERERGLPILSVIFPARADRAPFVRFAKGWADPDIGSRSYVDPATGRLLGDLKGQSFFDSVLEVHRFLALQGIARSSGRMITGAAALALIFFALSGLYLRWPRHPFRWKEWFDVSTRRRGRMALRMIHVSIGPIFLILYLYSALTGLWWAFDWYQRGAKYLLTGESAPEIQGEPASTRLDTAKSVNRAWAGLQSRLKEQQHGRVIIIVPRGPQPALFLVGANGAFDANAVDQYRVDQQSGRVIGVTRAADIRLAQRIQLDMRQMHMGGILGLPGRIAMLLSALSIVLLAITGTMMHRSRRGKSRMKAMRAFSG